MNLTRHLTDGRNLQSIALTDLEGRSISYGLLRQYVSDVDVGIGQKATLIFPNSVAFVILFLALAYREFAINPLNPAYNAKELEFYINDVQSEVIYICKTLVQGFHVELAQKLGIKLIAVEFNQTLAFEVLCEPKFTKPTQQLPAGTVLLLHTSGTTSRPKCVPLTHSNIIASVQNIIGTYKLTEQDSSFIVMPLFHVHGLIGALFSTLGSGGKAVVAGKFSARLFWANVGECTWYSAVPTIHQILLKTALSQVVHKLRFIRSCSSALLPDIQTRLQDLFGTQVLQAYAMTEASHQMTSSPLNDKTKLGSVGKAQGKVQVCVHDGEVVVKGENVTSGYLNNDEAIKNSFVSIDGQTWFKTGDQGYLDEEGYVFLTGRLKELINRGGEKISPLEVDHVLISYGSDVTDAVTFGASDAIYGEAVHAAVILKKGSKVNEHQIIEHCKKHLAAYKCPAKVYLVDDFPRTATGKVQRRIVAAHFAQMKANL